MTRAVFLIEERSMKVLLDGLLPRLFPGLLFLLTERTAISKDYSSSHCS